jgi:Zn-dependent peptidase ImmA (M78 family)
VTEPAVVAFLKKWGKIPEAAIQNALRSAFPALQQVSPPVNLMKLAGLRNVSSIKTVDLNVDGMISQIEGRYIIELNKSHSHERRRFTCAHELGHTFFLEMEPSYSGARMRVVDKSLELRSNFEEHLCNLMAAEMLMPEQPFRKVLRGVGTSASNILATAELFRASVQATARRWVECSRFRLVVAFWEFRPEADQFFTKWVAKSPRVKLNTRASLLTKRDPAFDTFWSMSDAYRGRKWVSLGGVLDDYFVDAVVLRASDPKQILTLFVLENTAESILSTSISIEHSNQKSFSVSKFF